MEEAPHQQEDAHRAKHVEAHEVAEKPITVSDTTNPFTYVTIDDIQTGKCHLLPPRLTISALNFFLSNLTVMVTNRPPM